MNEDDLSTLARRRFLKSIGVLAGALALPAVMVSRSGYAKPVASPASSKVRWGMAVDTGKCGNGCNACVTACNTENGLQSHGRPEQDAQWIRKVTLTDRATGHVATLPMMCQHCETAPCVDVCPTGASFRRADGIVLVDKHICIGCRYCMMACPYKARSFVHEEVRDQKPWAPRGKGTVESCTMCVHRVDADRLPACVEACHIEGHQAIAFGDLNDPRSAVALQLKARGGTQIRADLRLNTGVRYQGL